MNLLCRLGIHAWAGCICKRCRKTSGKEHRWDGCKCSQCGRSRNEEHRWNKCKCTICGQIRDVDHVWNKCKCTICAQVRDTDHVWTAVRCSICRTKLTPEEWANGLKDKKDYRSLAAIYCTGSNSEEFQRKRAIANRILLEAGSVAVDGILKELSKATGGSIYLADLLIDIGHPKAVPALKRKLEAGDFDAYGSSKYREFIAKFDPDVREEIEYEEWKKEEKLAWARSNVARYTESEMLSALCLLCEAYANNDPLYEELEPVATEIGRRLDQHGGISEMRRVFYMIPVIKGRRALEMHWGGIGDWRG